MTSSKITKRALFASVLAMILCVAMLVGTTFAWFTDTAATAVNKIQAGTLDVDLIGATSTDSIVGTGLRFVSADGVTKGEAILWEPGATYRTEGFRVANKGDLALKYKLILNGVKGDAELIDAIDFKIVSGNGAEIALGEEVSLSPNGTSDVFFLEGTMKTTAGNECQGKSITGIGVTVIAAQDTVETDSNNDQYDANAKYDAVVSTEAELRTAIASAKKILLNGDITLTGTLNVNRGLVIEGNGYTISGAPLYFYDTNNGDVKISNVVFDRPVSDNNNASALIISKTKTIVIDGCTFNNAQWDSLQITAFPEDADITVNNCTFKNDTVQGERYIHIQAPTKNSTATVTISNNSFGSAEKLRNDIVGIYFVKLTGIDFGGNNTFADTSVTTIYVCGASTTDRISSADAYNRFCGIE